MTTNYVLIAEDNEDQLVLIQRAFRKSGLRSELVCVVHGEEALDFLYGRGQHTGRNVTELPKLVVLDLNMPRVNGLEVLARIRAEPLTACLPVVILTTSDEKRDLIACYASGANSYVRKPVGFGDFTDIVKEIGHYWLNVNQPC